MAMANTILMIPFVLLTLLLPLALTVVLQVWLCKKGPRLGLILPILSFLSTLLITLTLLLNVTYASGGSTRVSYTDEVTGEMVYVEEPVEETREIEFPTRALGAVAVMFLVGNIPTVVFGGIWLHYRKQRLWKDDLKKMSIEDLE